MLKIAPIKETNRLKEYIKQSIIADRLFTIIKHKGYWVDVYDQYGSMLMSDDRMAHIGNEQNGKVYLFEPLPNAGWRQKRININ